MPIPFCVCPVCSAAREAGDKNLRRRSSVLVNDDLLVDIGPDMSSASFAHGVTLTGVRACLLTHAHEDHFDPEYIMCRHAEYGTVVPGDLLIAGSAETLEAIDAIISRRCEYGSIFEVATQASLHLKPLAVAPLEPCQVGDYRVTPIPANHGADQGSLLYSVEHGDRAIFYGADTSVLSDDVWDYLVKDRLRYDAVILDHTYGVGFDSTPAGHLASGDVAAHADRFRGEGLLKGDGQVYATHISHEGCLEHDELDEYAQRHGYRVAFDGLRLSLGD